MRTLKYLFEHLKGRDLRIEWMRWKFIVGGSAKERTAQPTRHARQIDPTIFIYWPALGNIADVMAVIIVTIETMLHSKFQVSLAPRRRIEDFERACDPRDISSTLAGSGYDDD